MEAYLVAFRQSLALFLKKEELPREALGDLADLLGTAETLCERLREIAHQGGTLSKKELRRRLFVLQIMIEQDIPMIFADLLPPLRKLSGENLSEKDE